MNTETVETAETSTVTAAEVQAVNSALPVLNPAQLSASIELLSKLETVRGIHTNYIVVDSKDVTTVSNYVIKTGSVCIQLDAPSFPALELKKNGKFALPTIRSYKEENVSPTYAYPGKTAFDAAMFADMHAGRQESKTRPVVSAVAQVEEVQVAA